jgi:hypothetical protein
MTLTQRSRDQKLRITSQMVYSASENKCKVTCKACRLQFVLYLFSIVFFALHNCILVFFTILIHSAHGTKAMIRVGGASLFDQLLLPHRPLSSNFLPVFGCPLAKNLTLHLRASIEAWFRTATSIRLTATRLQNRCSWRHESEYEIHWEKQDPV